MNFDETLNKYLQQLEITPKELADASGLSPAVISRYRSGMRTPQAGSPQLKQLATAICTIGESKEPGKWNPEQMEEKLSSALRSSAHYTRHMAHNLDELINALKINVSGMSRATSYDASYISRIRKGQRTPSDIAVFNRSISSYIAKAYSSEADLDKLSDLMGISSDAFLDHTAKQILIEQYLTEKKPDQIPDSVRHFLTEIDSFNLEDYMRKIHFDDIKVPRVPFAFPTSKNYYGLEAMKQGELDFLKATVLSASKDPVYMYSDLPMEDMGKDEDFKKKYIFGLGMLIKKGHHLYVIHNLNRPFSEMMMGLEGWIPLYMTGQISPYYFASADSHVFGHLQNVSGSAALDGQCVYHHHVDGKHYLTNNKQEIAYYQKRAQDMLSEASPLMNIYRKAQMDAFATFMQKDTASAGDRKRVGYTLPLHTISDDLLAQILDRHHISGVERESIEIHVKQARYNIEILLSRGTVTDITSALSDEEFTQYPPALSLSTMFFDRNLTYTPEEYRQHLKQTLEFADRHPGYIFKQAQQFAFRNIQITIHHNQWVMVSKGRSTALHFVIRHPLLRDAIEKLY